MASPTRGSRLARLPFGPDASRKPFEQRAELAGAEEVLRVPLHAEAEARRGILDRFDDAVGRGGRGGEAGGDAPSPPGGGGCSLRALRRPAARASASPAANPCRPRPRAPARTAGAAAPPGCARSAPAICDGMSCTSVPPQATFRTWTPRQIAKIGRSRCARRGDQRDLELVAPRLRFLDRGVRAPRRSATARRRRRRSAAGRRCRRAPRSIGIDGSRMRGSPPAWRIDCR